MDERAKMIGVIVKLLADEYERDDKLKIWFIIMEYKMMNYRYSEEGGVFKELEYAI